MKHLTILVALIALITNACSSSKKGKLSEMSNEEQSEFFTKIAFGGRVKRANIVKHLENNTWGLYLEVYDTADLLPRLVKSSQINKEVTHCLSCIFTKDSTTDKWRMQLTMYQLHFYSEYINSEFKTTAGIENYCISMYNFEHGNVWIADYWEMEDFPWLKDKKLHTDVNKFNNIDEAMATVAPPYAIRIYENIKNHIPNYLD